MSKTGLFGRFYFQPARWFAVIPWPLSRKILLMLAPLILVVSVNVSFSVLSLYNLKASNQAKTTAASHVEAAERVDQFLTSQLDFYSDAVLVSQPTTINDIYSARLDQALVRFGEFTPSASPVGQRLKDTHRQLLMLYPRLSDVLLELGGALSLRQFSQARQMWEQNSQLLNELQLLSTNLVRDTQNELKRLEGEVTNTLDSTLWLHLLLNSLLLLTVAAIAYIFIATLGQTMRGLKSELNQLTQGNIDVQIKTYHRDEIGELITVLNRALGLLRQIISSSNIGREVTGLTRYLASETGSNPARSDTPPPEYVLSQISRAVEELTQAARFTALVIIQGERFLYISPAFEVITGYTRSELQQLNFWEVAHPQYREHFKQHGLAHQENKPVPRQYDFKILTRSGEERWLHLNLNFIELEGKRAGLGTLVDITELKVTEEELAAEKERLAVTLQSIGDGVIATDHTGRVVLLNSVAVTLTGWSQAEAQNRPVSAILKLINPHNGLPVADPVQQVLDSKQRVELTEQMALVSRTGVQRVISDSAAPITDPHTGRLQGVVLVFRDVTESQKMEQEILKTQKLESVGLLAGGIAHDFNNILTAAVGYLSLAKLEAGDQNSRLYELLDEAEVAIFRSKGLTQQLLTFAKGGAPIKKVTTLEPLLDETVRFALRGSNAGYELEFKAKLWPVEIDEGQVAQVIHNLAINAMQAMPEGGIVRIRGENLPVQESGLSRVIPLNLTQNYVRVIFSDEGSGISEEMLPKIFDPYFTTKPGGSGLGLATCFSIMRKHDGFIRVVESSARGTTFEIYLPAIQSVLPVDLPQTLPSPGAGPVLSRSRILVLDDEKPVLAILKKVLTQRGYSVDTAEEGQQAIDYFRRAIEENKPYQLVITDLTLPGSLGGRQTLEQLKLLDPQVRAIVTSGYSNDPVMSNHREYGFMGALTKPFLIKQVHSLVEQVLAEPVQ